VDGLAALVDGLPDDLMMTSEQVVEMAQNPLITIGGHTRNHPILASLTPREAEEEIVKGKQDLEQTIGKEITTFAYPNGRLGIDYHPEHAELVRKAGFRLAVSTDWGSLKPGMDPFQIPRFTPWHRNGLRFLLDLWRCERGLLSA
jgi:peptidoglycan/xylan/chitin deacetylase (PgdA/CDA1 family)